MSELVEKLMHDNLMAVFNERDDTKRQAATKHMSSARRMGPV